MTFYYRKVCCGDYHRAGAPPIVEKNNCYTSPTRLVAYLEPFVRLQKQSIEELELMNECSGK